MDYTENAGTTVTWNIYVPPFPEIEALIEKYKGFCVAIRYRKGKYLFAFWDVTENDAKIIKNFKEELHGSGITEKSVQSNQAKKAE